MENFNDEEDADDYDKEPLTRRQPHPGHSSSRTRRGDESPIRRHLSPPLRMVSKISSVHIAGPRGRLPSRSVVRRPDPPSSKKSSVLTFYHQPQEEEEEDETTAMEQINVSHGSVPTRKDQSNKPHQEATTFLVNNNMKPTPDNDNNDDRWFKLHAFWKRCKRYKVLKLVQVLFAFYVLFITYADIGPPGGLRNQETGFIVDATSHSRTNRGLILVNGSLRPIVGQTMFQVICIGCSRGSAFFMYPTLVMVFFSKFRATTSFLDRTPIALYLNGDMHELHVYCGWTILIFSTIHTFFHLLRWGLQGNLYLVFEHRTGLTGFCIITSCALICLPMILYKDKVKYEIRKNLHYLFIIFAICLTFHVPTTAIPNGGFTYYVFGPLLLWWFVDMIFCMLFMSEKIETTKFDVLPTGVQMTMQVSTDFQNHGGQGGYCYVNFPWVDKNQWHAFSLFENPTNPTERQIFIQRGGDWTNKVHEILQRDTVRPVWVQGPFPSPYDSAEAYDNQILVASGIGITPALSVIRAHKDTRRINLIWAVRDPNLLQFFLRLLTLDNQGWNLIFYTGKVPLEEDEIEMFSNTNVCIITGRPKLQTIIPNIIYGVESGKGLSENYVPGQKEELASLLAETIQDKKKKSYDAGSVSASIVVKQTAAEHGFDWEGTTSSSSNKTKREYPSPFATMSEDEEAQKDREEYEHQKEVLLEQLRVGFKPWEEQEPISNENGGTTTCKNFVKNLDRNKILSTWGMLYCGGAAVVERDLRKISQEYKIDLHIESFGW